MLQNNNGKKVVVFTEQPLFGFTKMEKGSIVGDEGSKYNPETIINREKKLRLANFLKSIEAFLI